MIDAVIIADGKGNLLRTICSVLYQVQTMEAKVYVYMKESFDTSEYSSFPILFFDNWKELLKCLKYEEDGFLYFLNEGDTISNPFVFNTFMQRYNDLSKAAFYSSYIIDIGGLDFRDVYDDLFHFYGKMYQKKKFLKDCPKEFSYSNFAFLNYSYMFKDKVMWDGDLRNYVVCYDNQKREELMNRELYSDEGIELVSKLKKKYPKASYDLVVSTLLSVYAQYLKNNSIPQKEILISLIPDEISYSEDNLKIVKDNEVLIYLLQNKLSFMDFLTNLREGKL